METATQFKLSKNKLRRLQGWARAVHPGDWHDRCAIISKYLAQLDEPAALALIDRGWPAVFAAVEREWPEAFAEWNRDRVPDSAATAPVAGA